MRDNVDSVVNVIIWHMLLLKWDLWWIGLHSCNGRIIDGQLHSELAVNIVSLVSQYEEMLVINWTFVSVTLFSFIRWWLCNRNQHFFPVYADIFLQNCQSMIPVDPGITCFSILVPGLRKEIWDCNPSYNKSKTTCKALIIGLYFD